MRPHPARIWPWLLCLLVALPGASSCAPTPEPGNAPGHGSAEGAGEQGAREKGARENRLAGESSPYLLLHRYNPVDWYPWGPEALGKARREGKPIFLSVGYSTCYWCHVMERESFSDHEIAAVMNRHFVNIKVDREERPDLDEIYMLATQLLSRGRGGWPNSVFLTPSLEPFFAGTYFPPDDRYGRPGFRTILNGLHEAWTNRRADVEAQASRVADGMRQILEKQATTSIDVGDQPARAALANLVERFDSEHAGFGQAPKFPTPSNLFLLLHFATEAKAREMLGATLDHMARGGIYDQVGGGFHRYATDREWQIPHFEKMLYDNGSLLEVYALWHEQQRALGRVDAQSARILRQTAAFLAREMTSPEGALYSAIDAETNAREGAFYVWRPEELTEALAAKEHALAAPIFGFDKAPNFRDPHHPDDPPSHILHLPERLDEAAAARKTSLEDLEARLGPLRSKLLAVRAERERPLTDDKILTDWNGLAIAGLAQAGRVLEEPAMVRQAERAADFVLRHLRPEGQPLKHAWRGGTAKGGTAKIDAFLADYAYFVHGLLELHRATGETRWLAAAEELAKEMTNRLGDPERGGFFVAAPDPDLLSRSKDASDGARPSPNGMALLDLMRLAEETGKSEWANLATRAASAFASEVASAPAGHGTLARALARAVPGGSAIGSLRAEALSKVKAGLVRTGPGSIDARLSIAEGWHVNANPASDAFLVPTRLLDAAGQPIDAVYPPGEELETAFTESPIRVYADAVSIRAESTADSVWLEFQACDHQRCLEPVKIELRAGSAGDDR